MITTYDESPKFWQRTWFLALLIGAGVGVGVWWWQLKHAEVPAPASEVAAVKPAAGAKAGAKIDSALLVPPSIGDDGRPSDFTPEEWAALKDAMAQTPNPRAELDRVVEVPPLPEGLRTMAIAAGWARRRRAPPVGRKAAGTSP
ncbi:MAG: hypothetical protein QM742_06025 [Aquabacterium sp.]